MSAADRGAQETRLGSDSAAGRGKCASGGLSALFLCKMGEMHAQALPSIEINPDQETELEPLYRVLIHNDDVTPMQFVTHLLVTIFCLGYPEAVEIMLYAHNHGMSVVQILPKAEAEQRINKAHFAAGLEGYPLHFSLEPE